MARGAALASRLLAARVTIEEPQQFGLPTATVKNVARAQQRAAALEAKNGDALAAFHDALVERLITGLAALPATDTADVLERRRQVEACLAALQTLELAHPDVQDVRERFLALAVLLGKYQ